MNLKLSVMLIVLIASQGVLSAPNAGASDLNSIVCVERDLDSGKMLDRKIVLECTDKSMSQWCDSTKKAVSYHYSLRSLKTNELIEERLGVAKTTGETFLFEAWDQRMDFKIYLGDRQVSMLTIDGKEDDNVFDCR